MAKARIRVTDIYELETDDNDKLEQAIKELDTKGPEAARQYARIEYADHDFWVIWQG